MKRINFWALLATGLLGLPVLATYAEDDAKKPEANDSEVLFKKLDKNSDGKLAPDEIPEEQGRYFDRLVRLGDKDDNGELTKAEFDAAVNRSDAPVQGGGFGGGQGGPGGGRPMMDPKQTMERLDKNKDGKITKDEIPEDGPARFLLGVMERQKKDSLTVEDLERSRQMMGAAGSSGGPGEFLKRLDKNGDGKLQKDELPEPMQERFGRVFEKLGKRELSLEEFGRAMAEFSPPGGTPGAGGLGGRSDPAEQFKRMDTNGDGKVTLEEIPESFRDRARPMFERAKKDVLTLDDLQAFAQAREGDRKPGGERRPEAKPDGERPEVRREGDRKPEARREGQPPRDGERRPEGDRPREGERRDGDRRPEGDRPPQGEGRRGPMPRFFELLDKNKDGRLSRDELDRLKEVFGELDLNKDGQLDGAELLGPPQGPPGGRGPDKGPPEGRRPDGQPPRDGERRPDAQRPDGDKPRDGEPRREGDRPRDGDRKPEADRPRDGERKPDPRPEGRPPRREEEGDKPRDKA
ncbi:hypothetical protein LBMAG52_20470 [Planctomycetia bacterium]|nr:hypothetical protein LBMAG52_20470 [Planctomycetia bacterium]